MDERLRVEEFVAKLTVKPQPLQKSNEQLGQPTLTQSELPIHLLFPEVENSPSNMEMAELKELHVNGVAIQEPCSHQVEKGKTKWHQKRKNCQHSRKPTIQEAKDSDVRAPRVSLNWIERMSRH